MNNTVLDFFGFTHMPFSKLLSHKQLFHSSDYKQSFAQLEYGIPTEDIGRNRCAEWNPERLHVFTLKAASFEFPTITLLRVFDDPLQASCGQLST